MGESGALLLVIIMAAMAGATSDNHTSKEQAALQDISQGSNKFAIDLYRALSSQTSGNVFVSPLSAQIVLAQAYLGAKGPTAEELARLLSLPGTPEKALAGYNSLITVLKDPVLNLANRVFVEASADIKNEFQKNVEQYFLAPAEALSFTTDPESARKRINTWVEDQTNKKIKDLLAPSTITSNTRLVLTNAIHFKANWEHLFPERNTKQQPFFTSKSASVPVQMMSTKEKFGYYHDKELGAKILGMNYEGGHFQMIIILPDEIDGLKAVEEKLANTDLAGKIKGIQYHTDVVVTIPKFKLEETMMLNDILKSLGATTMFTDAADFSGITEKEPLKVSVVVQKSFVEVNEKGTEAAAATGMVCMARCLRIEPPPEKFIADHPFIFCIFSLASLAPLFIGRYTAP